MGSTNPMTTIVDGSGSLLQRFYLSKKNQLAVDLLNIKGTASIHQESFQPGDGSVKSPSSLAAVKRFGLFLVYGVLITSKKVEDKPVNTPVLAQLSPTVSPVKLDGANIELGDNVSITATSNGADAVYVYATKKSDTNVRIVEYFFDFSSGESEPGKTQASFDAHSKTRLAAAITGTGADDKRWVAYQAPDKSLRLRMFPGNTDVVVTQFDAMEQTPIALVIAPINGKLNFVVYYVHAGSKYLIRARRPVPEGDFVTSPVMSDDSLSLSTDLAASLNGDKILLSYILDGNTDYPMKFKSDSSWAG